MGNHLKIKKIIIQMIPFLDLFFGKINGDGVLFLNFSMFGENNVLTGSCFFSHRKSLLCTIIVRQLLAKILQFPSYKK